MYVLIKYSNLIGEYSCTSVFVYIGTCDSWSIIISGIICCVLSAEDIYDYYSG